MSPQCSAASFFDVGSMRWYMSNDHSSPSQTTSSMSATCLSRGIYLNTGKCFGQNRESNSRLPPEAEKTAACRSVRLKLTPQIIAAKQENKPDQPIDGLMVTLIKARRQGRPQT
eukprot:185738-Prorocentrum_minimum.AAC.3